MAQMGAAVFAGDFGTAHAMAGIFMLVKAVLLQWAPETGPAAAGMEFVFGRKQGVAAANAVVNAFSGAIGIFAGKRRLRAFFPADMELFGTEIVPPVLFGFVFGIHQDSIGFGSEVCIVPARLYQYKSMKLPEEIKYFNCKC